MDVSVLPERVMSTNAEIIRKLYGAFQHGRIEAILAVCTEDSTWVIPGAPALPYAGVHHGKAAVGAFFATLGATIEITQFTPENYVQEGDWVWVDGQYAGRDRAGPGQFQSVAWAHRWRLRSGLAQELHDHFDTLAIAEALGCR
jgi:uncharacterized protein